MKADMNYSPKTQMLPIHHYTSVIQTRSVYEKVIQPNLPNNFKEKAMEEEEYRLKLEEVPAILEQVFDDGKFKSFVDIVLKNEWGARMGPVVVQPPKEIH